ncbi:glycosyltransferase 87 family protein [Lichenicoccus sp.]|uniref:glycosyltransferase 87 family protein n=1 Tax=Lichenicoccus sp. TaxID=2781899 RepID=UPI003D0DE086
MLRTAQDRRHLLACLLILTGCVAWAAWRGQDVNWDLQNYHRYDAFALLHGRGARDAAPAGPQSFLNPLPYLLPYALHRLAPPLAAGLLVAVSQSAALMLAWAIAWTVSRRLLPAALATLAACTGPMVLGELGTSFADLGLAAPALASLLIVLRRPRGRAALLLAGALTGAAIGIKPTSLFLLPALLAASARLGSVRSACIVLAGIMLGGLLADGLWALHLWQVYGSPLFPFMNRLFRAPSAAFINFSDTRYHYQGLMHALAIPFRLAIGSDATGEVTIRDGRMAVAACLAVLRLWLHARLRRFDAGDALGAYLLLGLAGWLLLCPIERYAVSLEIVCGLFAVVALAPRPAAMALAAVTLVLTTKPADYFHRPWSEVLRVPAGIPPRATYGLLTHPLGIWVATPPYPAASFGMMSTLLRSQGILARRTDRILAASDGRLWLLNYDLPVMPVVRAEMRIHGFVLAPPCLRAASLFWINTVFCRGVRVGARPLAASKLVLGQKVHFSRSGAGLIYEIDGFAPTDPDGTWAEGHSSILAFHLDTATGAAGAVLSWRLAGVAGAPARHVAISVDDGRARTVTLGAPSYFAQTSLCIAPRQGGGTVQVRFVTDDSRSLAQLHLGRDPRPLSFKLYAMRLSPLSATSPGCPGSR